MDHRIVWWYLIIINVITLLLYALDKYKAVHKKRRIREVTLLGFSLIGGSAGALTAMLAFRHKTRKAHFKVGVPVMLAVHVMVIVVLLSAGV